MLYSLVMMPNNHDLDAVKPMLHSENFCAIVPAPFGALGIRTDGQDLLLEVVYLPPSSCQIAPGTKLAKAVALQIAGYFNDRNFVFDLPLASVGTAFQKKVWQVIAEIPCGTVLTYGEVARRIGSAPRAVGQACGANRVPLIIPCHRVTAATGLGGFAHHAEEDGFHLGVKRWLLAHEGFCNHA